jgi:hypothetical protein
MDGDIACGVDASVFMYSGKITMKTGAYQKYALFHHDGNLVKLHKCAARASGIGPDRRLFPPWPAWWLAVVLNCVA